MTKRTMVGHEDPETGETQWEQDYGEGADQTQKVWIGKVSHPYSTQETCPYSTGILRSQLCSGQHFVFCVNYTNKISMT